MTACLDWHGKKIRGLLESLQRCSLDFIYGTVDYNLVVPCELFAELIQK
jgi:hypothetical protein